MNRKAISLSLLFLIFLLYFLCEHIEASSKITEKSPEKGYTSKKDSKLKGAGVKPIYKDDRNIITGADTFRGMESPQNNNNQNIVIAPEVTENNDFIGEIDLKVDSHEQKSHILMYHPWGTKSHRGQQNALLIGLLSKGHIVTGVFSDESDVRHENYTEIIVKTRYIIVL